MKEKTENIKKNSRVYTKEKYKITKISKVSK